MANDNLQEMLDDLEHAANYEGSELGEYWSWLISGYSRVRDSLNSEFYQAWLKEVTSEHNRLKTEFVWEEEEITVTRTYKELVYVG